VQRGRCPRSFYPAYSASDKSELERAAKRHRLLRNLWPVYT